MGKNGEEDISIWEQKPDVFEGMWQDCIESIYILQKELFAALETNCHTGMEDCCCGNADRNKKEKKQEKNKRFFLSPAFPSPSSNPYCPVGKEKYMHVSKRLRTWYFGHSACQPRRTAGGGPAVMNANGLSKLRFPL